jgi:hypothetical protein
LGKVANQPISPNFPDPSDITSFNILLSLLITRIRIHQSLPDSTFFSNHHFPDSSNLISSAHYSNIPLFQHSIIPTFHCSNIPRRLRIQFPFCSYLITHFRIHPISPASISFYHYLLPESGFISHYQIQHSSAITTFRILQFSPASIFFYHYLLPTSGSTSYYYLHSSAITSSIPILPFSHHSNIPGM